MTPRPNPRQIKRPNKTVTFADHISEIRRRIAIIVGAFLLASALAYNYKDWLTQFIMQPLHGEKLVYLTPGGGFSFIFQISMYAGLLVMAPLVMYHIYAFIRPALPKRAQRSAVGVILAAVLLMAAGSCYGYFVAVPSALQFLSTFAGDAITPNLTADSYLSFFLTYIVGLGILFELPLLLLFIHWARPMTPKGLMKSERYVILGAFVVAALITPTPDVFNQLMIAAPLIVIYQLGVVAVLVAIRRRKGVVPSHTTQESAPSVSSDDTTTKVSLANPELRRAPLKATESGRRVPAVPRAAPQIARARPVDGFVRPQAKRVSTSPPRPSSRRMSIDGVSIIS
jgi:sec-independent protein translocase protein TatC